MYEKSKHVVGLLECLHILRVAILTLIDLYCEVSVLTLQVRSQMSGEVVVVYYEVKSTNSFTEYRFEKSV